MTLREKQSRFVKYLGMLIEFVYAHNGWELTLAEGYIGDSIDKPSEDTPHMRTGTHFLRLGIDLNLFIMGNWATKSCPEWLEIGRFWEGLDPLCVWGGRFKSVDLNHFSLKHGSVS